MVMAISLKILNKTQINAPAIGAQTSTVGEPSLANNGNAILFTGNWYAAMSSNDGGNWSHINPFTFFPPVNGGFCCDQTVHYAAAHDLTIWILQYSVAANTNTLRIAVKQGPLDAPGGWRFRDLRPAEVDPAWLGEWFDYNHAALSDKFLYIGTNAFTVGDNRFTRSIIFRLPLAELATGAALALEKFDTVNNFSLRCVQGATDTMYFVSHNGNLGNQIRVFSWPDASPTVTSRDISVRPWNPPRFSAPVGGINWLQRGDSRITGAWFGKDVIGVMWTANRQGVDRPFPFIRVVRINATTMTVLDEPDIWSKTTAYAYPEASANINGVAGITCFLGGGTRHPTHVVGVRDDAAGKWRLGIAFASTHSPVEGKWGDYLSCRRHASAGVDWIASGFTLQGGGERSNVRPDYVRFGFV
jgi:hypothetical protein